MPERRGPVIALFGPTAVGKSELAIAVADALGNRGVAAVAISADAYQLYRGLERLSGAPTATQRARLEHRLVASHAIDEEMSAGRFAREARSAIDEALSTGLVPIVVGGSGLYMQAALTDLPMRPPGPGKRESEPPEDRFWEARRRHPTLLYGTTRDRDELNRRIDVRVDQMIAEGAADEIAAAQEQASSTARRIIGFEEIPEGRIDEMKLRSRRYAKRQMTWLRRMELAGTLDLSSMTIEEAAGQIAAAARPAPQ